MTAAAIVDSASVSVGAARQVRGRTRIDPRAVRRIVSGVTAAALGVDPSVVSVELADDDGMLTVVAKTPIHVFPLGHGGQRPSGTLLERLTVARTSIWERTVELTGSSIGRVDLRITGVDLTERRRVA